MKKMNLAVLALCSVITMTTPAKADNYVRAYAGPVQIWLLGHWLDHTYACVWGSCYATGTSGTSGGLYVTRGYATNSQINAAICVADLDVTYGVTGVCHQHTNRMLYYGGTTLNTTVGGYSYSLAWFGVYGTGSEFYYERTACEAIYGLSKIAIQNEELTAQSEDPNLEQELETLLGSENEINSDARISVYPKVLFQVAKKNMENPQGNAIQNTMAEFEVMIDWKLGIDFPEKTRKLMRHYQEEMLNGKEYLDNQKLDEKEYETQASVHLKKYLDKMKKLLGKDNFTTLFE